MECNKRDNKEGIHDLIGAEAAAIADFKSRKSLVGLHPQDNPRYGWNDIGNSFLFADWYQGVARYVPEKEWYIYNGIIWKPDIGSLMTMELCKQLADKLMIYASSIIDERSRNEYMDFVRRWQSRKNRETILKDASGVYPIPIKCFDSDPYLLNCLNGTLNLENGEFYEHRPEDMLSKVSVASYDAAARCERWEQFISEVMEGDEDKALFLQKSLGYSLSGDTRYEALFILYGPTSRNGKSTAMETFLRIMCDYGKP